MRKSYPLLCSGRCRVISQVQGSLA